MTTYETGTAVDLEDLLAKLNTFATQAGGGDPAWIKGYTTNPQTTDGWWEVHKGSQSVSFKFPVGAQGPPEHMSVHHATGFISTATAPGAHTADSGNGFNTGTTGHTNTNLVGERAVADIGNGPFPSYHFFSEDPATNTYVHVVVEVVTGMFRHFGWGSLQKFGDNWVGGEYAYGHFQEPSVGANALDPDTNLLLDGLSTASNEEIKAATVRVTSGLANQGAAVWGVSIARVPTSNDTAGNVRRQIHGGYRVGLAARGFGNPLGNASSGVVPFYSIEAYYRDPNNRRVQLLGHMADVRALNVRNFSAAQEIVVGTDTWIIFPQSIKTTASVAFRSLFSGLAYKKNV